MLQQIYISLFTRDLEKLRSEVASYPDEESLWVPLPGTTNSGGNLTQHLIGNLRTYVGLALGNHAYVRDREAEFTRRTFTKVQLLAELGDLLPVVQDTVSNLSDDQLSGDYPRNALDMFPEQSFALILQHLLTHLSYHLGQINYHRRWVSVKS
jgi:hypothetical protein